MTTTNAILNTSQVRQLFNIDTLTCAQSLLLFQLSLWHSGDRNIGIEMQLYRNVLVTLCRQLLSREGTFIRRPTPDEDMNHEWLEWIRAESKRRIIYFTWSKSSLVNPDWARNSLD